MKSLLLVLCIPIMALSMNRFQEGGGGQGQPDYLNHWVSSNATISEQSICAQNLNCPMARNASRIWDHVTRVSAQAVANATAISVKTIEESARILNFNAEENPYLAVAAQTAVNNISIAHKGGQDKRNYLRQLILNSNEMTAQVYEQLSRRLGHK